MPAGMDGERRARSSVTSSRRRKPKRVEVLVLRSLLREMPWKYRTCASESLEVGSSFELYLRHVEELRLDQADDALACDAEDAGRACLTAAACPLNDSTLGCDRDPSENSCL